jgi:hypothetical protein
VYNHVLSWIDEPVFSRRFAGQEENMSDEGYQEGPPTYTFLTEEPADEYRILAEMHQKEAKQLLELARAAEAEDRQQEARLLMDVSAFRLSRAEELERTALGERDDPSVTEALAGEEEILSTYVPHSMAFFSEDELPPATVPMHMRPREPGGILRTWAKISSPIKKISGPIKKWFDDSAPNLSGEGSDPAGKIATPSK